MLESAWRVHVSPRWGTGSGCRHRPAQHRGVDCATWRKGAGATTVLRAHGVLSGILADAVKAKRLAVNPAKGVENLPRKTGKRHVYLSADDVYRLADESGSAPGRSCWCWPTPASGGVKRSPCECAMSSFSGGGSRCRRTPYNSGAACCRADQGPQGTLGAGARVRAQRAVHAVRGQGAGRSRVPGPRRRLSAAAEVVDRVVPGRGQESQGAEDHAARPAAHLRVAGGVTPGSTCWHCSACSDTPQRR